jgi:putative hemolysin
MTLEAVLILCLIVANGVFAMAEIAIVSSRKARLKAMADEGDERAGAALALADHPDDFLSTVQIGITFVGIFAGVFGGATIAKELGAQLDRVTWIAPHGETLGLAIVVLVITYLSLVIGELVPKRIALSNRERIASRLASPMAALARVARPAVRVLSVSTSAIVRLLRVRPDSEAAVTEEELTSMLELGRQTGEFHPAEEEMIKGVFALGDRTARSIMTPRHAVVWLDLTKPVDVLQRTIVDHGLSRYPAAEGDLDHFVGIIEVRDLLARCYSGGAVDLRADVTQPLVFFENTSALEILHQFQSARAEIGIVVDEYGGFEGIVTIHDLATRVLGLGEEEGAITVRDANSWLIDADLDFEDVAGEIGFRRDDKGDYDTMAGFVLFHLEGRLPKVADAFESGGFRFEIVDMDARRIDKLLVTKTGHQAAENEPPRRK